MKIAFLNLYSGINNRGAENFVHELASRLGEKENMILIGGGKVELTNVKSFHVSVPISQPTHNASSMAKRLFLDPASLSTLFFTWKCLPRLLREKPDWIVPVNGFWQLVICKLVSIFTGSRILVTGHSGPGWDERWNLYLKPDIFVATTGPAGEWAKKTCFWTKVTVIAYGVDIDKFAKAKPVELDLERPIILCPAAAVPYKRIPLAIEAVSKREKGSLLHLGSGIKNYELGIMGTKLLGKKRFLSLSVLPEELPKYYAACDVVTLPSQPQENSPLVFLEAIAAGKPVVATDSKRNRWLLDQFGIYVDPEDVDAYSQALGKAIESPLDTKVLTGLRERFSLTTVLKQYTHYFNDLNH